MRAIGRQPEATAKIQTAMIIIGAFAEALTIYAFVTVFLHSEQDLTIRSEADARTFPLRGAARGSVRERFDRLQTRTHPDPGLHRLRDDPFALRVEADPRPGARARRAKIAGDFAEADRRKAEADQRKAKYEQELRNIDAQARQKIQGGRRRRSARRRRDPGSGAEDGAGSGSSARTVEEVAREREKAKEQVKEQVIHLAAPRRRSPHQAGRSGAAQAGW